MHKKNNRLGEENINYQGDTMKIVEYKNTSDITVEFQDNYMAHVHSAYKEFQNGIVKNPYHKSIYGAGV